MLLNPEQTRSLFHDALENAYAVLAVNADSPAAITDCLEAAAACDAPIIIETSLWQLTGWSFGAGDPILGLDRYMADLRVLAGSSRYAAVPVAFHTDHIKGPETISILQHAMGIGASSISLDSSELSAAENIGHLCTLCGFAADRDLSVTLEMEVGVDDGVTDLDETRSLFGEVEARHPGRLALWAPGVGTRHGLGGGDGFSPEAVGAHRALASELAGRPIGIALHGSSGLSDEQLTAAVKAGVAKVNWSSESLLIRARALRDYYTTHGHRLVKEDATFKAHAMDNGPQSFVGEVYRPAVMARIKTLGGEGRASRFLPSMG
jgi:fructose/tagatose bisphosphate aldolase